ncbi:hypothetical protein BDZ89DRAFT_176649 [Hymenopellis radicata]|nr:hypothetical protein BDZ89DRAFT_176649 [Hymenopellis radicata]
MRPTLPVELWLEICRYCDTQALKNLRLVNRRWTAVNKCAEARLFSILAVHLGFMYHDDQYSLPIRTGAIAFLQAITQSETNLGGHVRFLSITSACEKSLPSITGT